MDWSKDESLRLIKEYKNYPLLWDPNNRDYYNKAKKNDAWGEIAKCFNADAEKVKNKMTSLLSSFRREKAKTKRRTIRTGTGATKEAYRSKWFAFKSLLFLIDNRDKQSGNGTESGESSCFDVTRIKNNEDESDRLSEDDNWSEGEPAQNAQNTEIDPNKHLDTNNSKRLKEKTDPPKSTTPKRLKTSNSVATTKDCHIEAAVNYHQKQDDPDMLYAQYLASKLKQFSGKTRVLVEHAINEIIFEAEMRLYDDSFVLNHVK